MSDKPQRGDAYAPYTPREIDLQAEVERLENRLRNAELALNGSIDTNFYWDDPDAKWVEVSSDEIVRRIG